MGNPITFYPGVDLDDRHPLVRFIPPVPRGSASGWANDNLHLGSLILDPFGASPFVPVELARSGYRVIVAANNPVSRFLLEFNTNKPTAANLQSALADLAAQRKGDTRLEPYIRSLYITDCHQCDREVEAESFIWERDTNTLLARNYSCPVCGESGEFPVTDQDINRAASFARNPLHKARALERVASISDPDRPHVEEALATYSDRAVFSLFTLINRLDSYPPSHAHHQPIIALLLAAFDRGNNLWSYRARRPRPKQLSIPPRYYEHNIWMALENAVGFLSDGASNIPLTRWPDLPPSSGGISIYDGRIKELAESMPDANIDAVITTFPRPNQAYWTLSALWAGWLWGREAIGPFKSVLRRRRYDWSWHCEALYSALAALDPLLRSGTPVLGLLPEAESGFLAAVIVSAYAASFDLTGIALQSEKDQAQMTWSHNPTVHTQVNVNLYEHVKSNQTTAAEFLSQRGEPSAFINVQAVVLENMAGTGTLTAPELDPRRGAVSPTNILVNANHIIENTFNKAGLFRRYDSSDKSLEVGKWWLVHPEGSAIPLSDRIEMEFVNYLLQHPGSTRLDITSHLNQQFPGMNTPARSLIETCLESYAEERPANSTLWYMGQKEQARNRKQDIANIYASLQVVGEKLGFIIQGERPLLWLDEGSTISLAFIVFASATFSETILTETLPPEKSIIVIPGSRASLAIYKKRNNPYLSEILNRGWRFMKFRHVHYLLDSPLLTRENLIENLDLDPLTIDTSQLRLL